MRALKVCLMLAATTLLAAVSLAQSGTKSPSVVLTRKVITPAAFVVGQAVKFEGTIDNLKPGTSIRVTGMSANASCSFNPMSSMPSGTVAADGSFAFSVDGFFGPENAPRSGCTVTTAFRGTFPTGAETTPSFNSTFTAATPQVYVVSDTSKLAARLGYALTREHGDCDGISNPGSHPVGMRTVGSDIMFNIRSGPAGTECTWSGRASVLPSGMRLTAVSAPVEKTGSCTLTTSPGAVSSWTVVSTSNPAAYGSNTAGPNPNGAGYPVAVLFATPIKLDCGNTLVNDKIVSVKLDTFTFSGPPGLTFP